MALPVHCKNDERSLLTSTVQIFVKPRAEDSSDEEDSTDVKKSSQDSTVIELLQTEDATNDTVVNDTEQSAEVKTPSGHRREV